MTTLLIATSPRSTWSTAPDAESATALRALLAGRFDELRRRGQLDPFAFDVGTGAEAMEAGHLVLGAGYWCGGHPCQPPLNRNGTAWGIPVEGAEKRAVVPNLSTPAGRAGLFRLAAM